jgi:hypothetical protein
VELQLAEYETLAGRFHHDFGHLLSGVDFENPLDLCKFAARFFRLRLAATPYASLRLSSSTLVGSFHPTRYCRCRGTGAAPGPPLKGDSRLDLAMEASIFKKIGV